MSDQQNPGAERNDRTLSEISHLFLSSVRDRQTGGSPRPQRTPPRAKPRPNAPTDTPIDLTADELARVFESNSPPTHRTQPTRSPDGTQSHLPPVTAVLGSHLNGRQRDRVREYAAHLCKSGERIGLIEVDAAEFRLSCFELGSETAPAQPDTCDTLDARRISEALEEMSWDVDRWILNLPNPRLAEARPLLRMVSDWTVLATCDHDGVIACYRSLKGLADLHAHDPSAHDHAPTLSLALLDSDDELQAMRVFRKLSAVCQQFLHWPLESESPVVAAGSVVEHHVLECRAGRDKAPSAGAPQWQIVSNFLSRSGGDAPGVAIDGPAAPVAQSEPVPRAAAPVPQSAGVPISADPPAAPAQTLSHAVDAAETPFMDVIELPSGVDSSAAIVSATLRGESGLVECPVKPPMLDDACLAVARDRRLVLLAVARQGLSDLRAIGEAWRWMNENRALISMAVPQLSIDAHQMPHLRLLIDRADLSASTLQPLLQSGNVTVQTYRKLRWGPKTGLLLEAA